MTLVSKLKAMIAAGLATKDELSEIRRAADVELKRIEAEEDGWTWQSAGAGGDGEKKIKFREFL